MNMRSIQRGEVWWADLGEPRGSEPGKRRPVVVVQRDDLTKSRLQTIMIVPLTSNMKRAAAFGNVSLARRRTRLGIDSVALACQVETLDKAFFDQYVSKLDPSDMLRIDVALQSNLGLA